LVCTPVPLGCILNLESLFGGSNGSTGTRTLLMEERSSDLSAFFPNDRQGQALTQKTLVSRGRRSTYLTISMTQLETTPNRNCRIPQQPLYPLGINP
jgi:hypothetical protein